MLAGSNPSLMQQALSAVRNDYSLARLYAMGADAPVTGKSLHANEPDAPASS